MKANAAGFTIEHVEAAMEQTGIGFEMTLRGLIALRGGGGE